MILKSITISGFKSFAQKTVIDLSKNITGVVGPNGSGKSNIGESIRFVLGEQSMKSIRSKSLADLIFRGPDGGRTLSRGSVSIELDNSNGKPSVADENLSKILILDTIVLSREVYSDGGSTYKINGAEVRLKDVQQVLAFAGIGASNHTIISQGEADKILSASAKDRKEMIEDALGLKIHQVRLRESEKKLKKVEENINVANLIKKEIYPELSHLKVQMEKISKVEVEREKLLAAYLNYFVYEEKQILSLQNAIKETEDIEKQIESTQNNIIDVQNEIESLSHVRSVPKNDDMKMSLIQKRYEIQGAISQARYEIDFIKRNTIKADTHIKVEKDLFKKYNSDINANANNIIQAINANDTVVARDSASRILNITETSKSWYHEESNSANNEVKIKELEEIIAQNEFNLKDIDLQISNIQEVKEDTSVIMRIKSLYDTKSSLEKSLASLRNKKEMQHRDMLSLSERERSFIFNLEEASKIVGPQVLNYKTHNIDANYNHIANERMIERHKIRIEEIGIIDGASIKNSYEELSDRYNHIEKEISDLIASKESVDKLIEELEENLKSDFNKGLEKINFAFDNYFNQVFSGGRARLSVVKYMEDDGDSEVMQGIDLTLSLPNKKISDINMLSGGERTLSSIALLFAMTSIVPPPFMVLDETDAALDESNARKYGKLLKKLGEKSRLLVVTHNRETMNECEVLYGVTMNNMGESKIISIKFD